MNNETPQENKSKKALRAGTFVLAGYGLSQIIRLLSNIVLTRLLVPEFFGIMALAQVVFQGLSLFSDIGISQSLIRSPKSSDEKFVNTAWTLQVIRGLILFAVMILISYPIARFYKEDLLIYIIPVLSINSILMGLQSTSLVILNKELNLGKLTYIEVVVQILSTVFIIILAYFFRNVWALVIGGLCSSTIRTIWSHLLKSEIKNRFHLEKGAVKELLSFGKWILLSTAMMFLATQSDRLLFGKLFTLSFFGVYNIAVIFAELPKQVITQISGRVLYPLISSFSHLPRKELKKKIEKQRKIMLLLLLLLVALLTCFGDVLIIKIYDQRYVDAAWILPLLAIGIWPLILYATIDRSLYAIGKPNYSAVGNSLKFIYMLISVPTAYHFAGNFGAVLAVALNDIPVYLVTNFGLLKEKLSLLKQDLLATFVLLLFISMLIFIRINTGMGFPGSYGY